MTSVDGDDDENASLSGDDDQEKSRKRKERLEQNRISARESRKRKKTMIEELQRTVITLSRENKDLNERNESLRRQLMEIGAKYPNIVPLQAIVGQATAPTADGAPTGAGDDGSTTQGGAPAPAPSALSSLNPLNWLGGGGAPAPAADGGSSSNQANV